MLWQKILVTGADGFIGSHLVEALVRQGDQVRAFVLYIADVMGTEVQIETESHRLRPQKSEVERPRADNTKARELLGWEPAYGGLRRGLEETAAWFIDPANLQLKYLLNFELQFSERDCLVDELFELEVGEAAANLGFEFAFTEGQASNADLCRPLFLARLDCNDLPGGKVNQYEVERLFEQVPTCRYAEAS